MKKSTLFTFAIAITTVMLVLFGVQMVTATPNSPLAVPDQVPPIWVDTTGPANGDWVVKTEGVTGQEIPTANLTADPPNEWSRLQSNGFAVSGRTEICHPFRGGQFGWHTSVFLLEGNSWTEIPTTVEWYPDEEGQLMSCAFAPISGTYALFGYWEWFEGFKTPEPTFEFRQLSEVDILF